MRRSYQAYTTTTSAQPGCWIYMLSGVVGQQSGNVVVIDDTAELDSSTKKGTRQVNKLHVYVNHAI